MTRLKFLKTFFLVFAIAIATRAFFLQTGGDTRLERLASRQFSSKVTALPRRGLILDRNGEGLAMSSKVRSLFFRPEIIRKEMSAQERDRAVYNLAKILNASV